MIARLTRREREYLDLIVRHPGETQRAIARRMQCRVGTVQRHATHVYQKIGANGRCEATVKVLRGEVEEK